MPLSPPDWVLGHFTDLLCPNVARHLPSPTLVFYLRRTCRAWRDAIDGLDAKSGAWREMLVAFGVRGGQICSPFGDAKVSYEIILCRYHKVLSRARELARGRLQQFPLLSFDDFAHSFATTLGQMLGWLLRVAEIAATELLVEINDALPQGMALEDALALFHSIGSTNIGSTNIGAAETWVRLRLGNLHQQFQTGSLELAGVIASRVQHAPAHTIQRAHASFESFLKKMCNRVLVRLEDRDMAFACAFVRMAAPLEDIKVVARNRLHQTLTSAEREDDAPPAIPT